jgi:hypothetical protein
MTTQGQCRVKVTFSLALSAISEPLFDVSERNFCIHIRGVNLLSTKAPSARIPPRESEKMKLKEQDVSRLCQRAK